MKIEVKNRGGSRVLPDGILLSETVRHDKLIDSSGVDGPTMY